jgi:hypothetical protein
VTGPPRTDPFRARRVVAAGGLRRPSARSTAYSREQGAQWRAHRVKSGGEPLLRMCGESGLLTQGHRHSVTEPRHRASSSGFAHATEPPTRRQIAWWAPVRVAAGSPLIPRHTRASPGENAVSGRKRNQQKRRELASRRETRARDLPMTSCSETGSTRPLSDHSP